MIPSRLRAPLHRLRRRRVQRRYFDQVVAPHIDVAALRDSAFERAVQRYWMRHFGRRVDTRWHLVFRERLGVEDLRFMPTLEWYDDVVPALNEPSMRRAYVDKNLAEVFLGRLRTPPNLLRRIHGHYRDGDHRPLSRAEAFTALAGGEGRAVLKESLIDNGMGVHLLELGDGRVRRDGEPLDLDRLEREHGRNFVVQAYQRQHPALAAPHPASLNTVRIVTLRLGGEVRRLMAWARFGCDGGFTDNSAQGAIGCSIDETGRLGPWASDAAGTLHRTHPTTGLAFAGHRLPGIDEAGALALELHDRVHHMDYVCWDFAIDPEGRPVFIEMNFRGRPNTVQFITRAPLFGELTDEVLAHARHVSGRAPAPRPPASPR